MSIDDQVDVLGEPFDNAKGLRKRSSAFENESRKTGYARNLK